MKNLLLLISILLIVLSCNKKPEVSLTFLDEYVVADSIQFKNSLIGGLSGIDYYNGKYFMIVDDARNPRYITAKIKLEKDTISSIDFMDVIKIGDTIQSFYKENNWLDLESIFVEENGGIHFVGEGSTSRGKDPQVFSINEENSSVTNYMIPDYFKANSPQKPKHNATFESSSKSFDGKGFWVGMEGVLESDGEEPGFEKAQSPARITYYDYQIKQPTKQFVYLLDKIDNPPKGRFNTNGITGILEFEENRFFVLERAYQSGYGIDSNRLKIYEILIDENSTNTLDILSLKNTSFQPVKKRLLFDFDLVKNKLTDSIVDNIEGITFGPKLSNGNQSLILVSDDNFQKYGKQLNQFLLLEIEKK